MNKKIIIAIIAIIAFYTVGYFIYIQDCPDLICGEDNCDKNCSRHWRGSSEGDYYYYDGCSEEEFYSCINNTKDYNLTLENSTGNLTSLTGYYWTIPNNVSIEYRKTYTYAHATGAWDL